MTPISSLAASTGDPAMLPNSPLPPSPPHQVHCKVFSFSSFFFSFFFPQLLLLQVLALACSSHAFFVESCFLCAVVQQLLEHVFLHAAPPTPSRDSLQSEPLYGSSLQQVRSQLRLPQVHSNATLRKQHCLSCIPSKLAALEAETLQSLSPAAVPWVQVSAVLVSLALSLCVALSINYNFLIFPQTPVTNHTLGAVAKPRSSNQCRPSTARAEGLTLPF